jgi:tRNA-2-methylthio-N6-dimethylallyladenosine synthase
MFSFKYSVRPNTLASKRMPDDVPEGEKTRRIIELQALQREIQTRLHETSVGTVVDVLVDSASRREPGELSGRTSGNVVVNFRLPTDTLQWRPDLAPGADASTWIGRTVSIRILRAGPHSLRGELTSCA